MRTRIKKMDASLCCSGSPLCPRTQKLSFTTRGAIGTGNRERYHAVFLPRDCARTKLVTYIHNMCTRARALRRLRLD